MMFHCVHVVMLIQLLFILMETALQWEQQIIQSKYGTLESTDYYNTTKVYATIGYIYLHSIFVVFFKSIITNSNTFL